MPTVSLGDGDLYYEERGQGPPLLLVPDMLTPRFYSEELASAIPDATLLSGGGHFAPVIVPDEYNAAVGAFLASHRNR